MMRKQKKPRDGGASAELPEQQSKLSKIFGELPLNDSAGVLQALDEAVEELESSRRVEDSDSSGAEDDDEFEAVEEVRARFDNDDPGNLLTTAEVNNALKRDDGEGSRNDPNEEPEIMKKGLRSRMRRIKERKKKRRERELEVAGIFGTTGKPSRWSLSHYLQSVASTREKRVVALSAWILALVGLIISLVFVTKDFIESRREMASTVRYTESEVMEIPSLWFCRVDTELPMFEDFPNAQFKGQPLVWIDFLRGSSFNFNLTYPATTQLQQVGHLSVDRRGERCEHVGEMDPDVFYNENTNKPRCFHCLTVSRTPAITITEPKDDEDDVDDKSRSNDDSSDVFTDYIEDRKRRLSFRLAQHSILLSCRRSQNSFLPIVFLFVRDELKRYHSELSERGILDFDDLEADSGRNDHLLWPRFRLGYRNGTVDFAVFDIIDMFCNVYLFSGFFYPSTSPSIKYRFKSSYNRWERVGPGPFYPRNYSEYYNRVTDNAMGPKEQNAEVGGEQLDALAVHFDSALRVMTNHSRLGDPETIAVLEPQDAAQVRLRRDVVLRRESFSAQVLRTRLRSADVKAANFVYFLEVSFASFMTRVVSDQLTVSWPAFIADFFGLTSLFLDVSVYTLIVSPMVMRARKKALVARKLKRTGAEAV